MRADTPMKVADIVTARTPDWRALEQDIAWLRATRGTRLDPGRVMAFARRYRAACSDLALAAGMRFPAGTVDYLQQLVADAHTQLYRTESFSILTWVRGLLVDVPSRTLGDPCTWIAVLVFALLFVGGMAATAVRPGFATEVVGDAGLATFEAMYAEPPGSGGFTTDRATMAGFYVFNNAGIGLQCFAGGMLCGVGSLLVLAFNGLFLGTVFGHMLGSPAADHFGEFVTAHAPFELTAVVLSAAAGLRLGWSIIDTRGWTRGDSLRRTAPMALETAGLATVLFILAAFIEAFVSASAAGHALKAAVCCGSSLVLAFYFSTAAFARREAGHAR